MSEPVKLWLWRNGDHYLAYDNPMPCYPDGGDPLVLGEPAAVAFLMPSTYGWADNPAKPVPLDERINRPNSSMRKRE